MSEHMRVDLPESPPYPTDTVCFMEFPLESCHGSSMMRSLAMQAMLESPVPDTGILLKEYLRERQISISVSIPADADPNSAEILRYLSDNHIPACAWIGARDSDGYFLNHQNADLYMKRAVSVAKWAERNGVNLGGVGIDIEPPFDAMSALTTGNYGAFARWIVSYRRWLLDHQQRDGAVARINDGVAQLRENYGLHVEAYTAPDILHRLLGLPSPSSLDVQVEMLYSSLYGVHKPLFSLLWNPAHDPALGIVNGAPGQTPGRDFGGKLESMEPEKKAKALRRMHLTTDQLIDDLRHANAVSIRKLGHPLKGFYVFALNGASVASRVTFAREQALGQR